MFDSTTFTINEDGFPVGNRAIDSETWRKFFASFAPNGVPYSPATNLEVTAAGGMDISVAEGVFVKNGAFGWLDGAKTITCSTSTSDQVIYIGFRLEPLDAYFTGDNVAAYTTFVPETDTALARINIPANATAITSGMITDLRGNRAYCGYATDLRTQAEEALANIDEFSVVAHASSHAPGGSDELTSVFDTFAATGNYGVFAGGAVTAQVTPDQTVAVSAGSIITPEGKRYAFSAVSALAATAAHATNPRIDIVYVSSAGVVTYLAGTAAASPAQPATPANGTILAAIARAANDNTIASSDITRQRDFISTASDFEDVNAVTESSNAFACDLAFKHTKNFSFPITNTTAKTVTFSNVPYGTADVILTIKATGTASVTWTLDGRTLVWPAGAPTLTTGYTYDILFSYVPILGKWVGRAQIGAAN